METNKPKYFTSPTCSLIIRTGNRIKYFGVLDITNLNHTLVVTLGRKINHIFI